MQIMPESEIFMHNINYLSIDIYVFFRFLSVQEI